MPVFTDIASGWLEWRRVTESRLFAQLSPLHQSWVRSLTLDETVVLLRFPDEGCSDLEFKSGPGAVAANADQTRASMLRRGLLAREPKGRPTKSSRLVLTHKGRQRRLLLDAFQQRVLDAMFRHLSPEQREVMRQLGEALSLSGDHPGNQ